MEEAAALVATARRPWIIAMDANMEPDKLEATGWPELAGVKLVHTHAPTCGASNFDMFMVGGGLQRAVVGVQTITNTSTNPHCRVQLLLKAEVTRRKRRILKRALHIPAIFPAGPHSASDTEAIEAADRESLPSPPPLTAERALSIDQAAAEWVSAARSYCGKLLRQDAGSYDKAHFMWREQSAGSARPSDATAFAAAQWRSLGREAAQGAAVTRRAAAAASAGKASS